MYVDIFHIVVELSVNSLRISTFFAVQCEVPTPTGGASRAVVYQSQVAVPRHPKHRVILLLDEVALL